MGGGFEPEKVWKKLERNSFANDNENSAMQMGGGGEQNWSRNMYFKGLSEKKVHTSRDFSIFTLS